MDQIILKLDSTSAGGNAEELQHSYIAGEIAKWFSHLGNSFLVSCGIKHVLTIAIPLLGCYPRERKFISKVLSTNVQSSFIYNSPNSNALQLVNT